MKFLSIGIVNPQRGAKQSKFNDNGCCVATTAPGARSLEIALFNVVLLVSHCGLSSRGDMQFAESGPS